VTFTGNAANLTFTGRVSGAAYREAIGSVDRNSDLVFANFDGMFKGLIQDFDTITITGNSSVEFSRKQTLTADTDFVFNVTSETLNNSAAPGQAMFTVNSFGWTYGDTISVNADASLAAGTYVLVNNWDSAYDVDFTINGVVGQNIVSGNRGFSIGESSNGKLYLQVKDLANGTFSAGAGVTAMDNVTVGSGSGDALSFGLGSEEVVTSGNTVIDGNVKAPYSEANTFTVASGNTKVNGDFNLSYGDDILDVKAGAEMEITGDLTLGHGNNEMIVGEGAEVTVKGDASFGGGSAKNIIALEKGAVMNVEGGFSTGTTGSGSALVMDVDSILNNSSGTGNKPIIAVEGVGSLTADKAGAKAIVNALDYNAGYNSTREYSIDGVSVERDVVTQIIGAATAETSDDVFAALTKVDNSLVVSWGRTEEEAGAALDAFKADSTLNLGEALVAVDDSLLDGFDSTDNLTKKNNGTLA